MINEQGEKEMYWLSRKRCPRCKRLHTELPDFIVPYKRHCAATIERAAQGDVEAIYEDNPDFEPNTAKRIRFWWDTVGPYFLYVLAGLELKIGAALDKTDFKAIIRAVVNSHHWVFTRSVLMPG